MKLKIQVLLIGSGKEPIALSLGVRDTLLVARDRIRRSDEAYSALELAFYEAKPWLNRTDQAVGKLQAKGVTEEVINQYTKDAPAMPMDRPLIEIFPETEWRQMAGRVHFLAIERKEHVAITFQPQAGALSQVHFNLRSEIVLLVSECWLLPCRWR